MKMALTRLLTYPVHCGCASRETVMRRASPAILLVGVATSPAYGQASASVPAGDPIYRDVDRLIDAGLVDTVIVGQRPYSQREIVRLARAAGRRLTSRQSDDRYAHRAIARVLARYATIDTAALDANATRGALHLAPLASLRLDHLYTTAVTHPVAENGLGTIEADLNTLTNNRQGRRYRSGSNVAIETESWARLGTMVVLQAQPRLVVAHLRDGGRTTISGELLSGSARMLWRNVSLTAGRENSYWGNAPQGGLFFSDNAPALTMARVATEQPVVLPGVFRRLGPVAATLQVADVGPSVRNSHSTLVAYKVSVQPTTALELGATFANHFGGAGSRPVGATERVIDLLPFVDIFRRHVDSLDIDSDKLLGIDARWRMERLGGMQLFSELAIEDFDVRRLRSVFTEDAALIIGARVPRLFVPALAGQVSYHTTGIRFYQHHLVRNGFASRRFTLGDDLGRTASGWYAAGRWEHADGIAFTADGAVERRSDDQYVGETTRPDAQGLVFRRVAHGLEDRRLRLIAGVDLQSRDGRRSASLRAGAERVRRRAVGSADGESRTHGVLETTIRLVP